MHHLLLFLYVLLCVFVYSNDVYVYSVFHPFGVLRPIMFGFQMLKISRNGAGPSLLVGHRMCNKGDEIILYDVDAYMKYGLVIKVGIGISGRLH